MPKDQVESIIYFNQGVSSFHSMVMHWQTLLTFLTVRSKRG